MRYFKSDTRRHGREVGIGLHKLEETTLPRIAHICAAYCKRVNERAGERNIPFDFVTWAKAFIRSSIVVSIWTDCSLGRWSMTAARETVNITIQRHRLMVIFMLKLILRKKNSFRNPKREWEQAQKHNNEGGREFNKLAHRTWSHCTTNVRRETRENDVASGVLILKVDWQLASRPFSNVVFLSFPSLSFRSSIPSLLF